MSEEVVLVNRAPVLTLWATIVAERLGFDRDEALSLGKTVAGLNAQAKGRSLGIYRATSESAKKARRRKRGESFWIELCGRAVPATRTPEGVRAVSGERPVEPGPVARYLEKKFGGDLDAVREAMEDLAGALSADDLAEKAFSLYEQFRPRIPPGKRGWGAKGKLDLALIRSLG